MRILITNDDGISSPALPRLAEWAKRLGEVTVVAPREEQSGKSQAIDFKNPVEIKRVALTDGVEAWAMNSTPADCVRFGVTGLRKSYDVVLSGINRGYNLGDDISYSGTVGAIFEAARLGIRAIALSTDIDSFENAFAEMDALYAFIEQHKLLERAQLLNVNIPSTPVKGISLTRQGGMFYSDDFVCNGNDMYMQVGEPIKYDSDDLSVDIIAIQHSHVSISPLTAHKTDLAAYAQLKNLNP
jgi:5'-nucleotidase